MNGPTRHGKFELAQPGSPNEATPRTRNAAAATQSSQLATRDTPSSLLRSHQEPGVDGSSTPHIEHPSFDTSELRLDEVARRAADLDPARDTLRLHPAGDVDRVTPEVVDRAASPEHAPDDWSRVHADSEFGPFRACRASAGAVATTR